MSTSSFQPTIDMRWGILSRNVLNPRIVVSFVLSPEPHLAPRLRAPCIGFAAADGVPNPQSSRDPARPPPSPVMYVQSTCLKMSTNKCVRCEGLGLFLFFAQNGYCQSFLSRDKSWKANRQCSNFSESNMVTLSSGLVLNPKRQWEIHRIKKRISY